MTRRGRRRVARLGVQALVLLGLQAVAVPVSAHNGPPFPILEDQPVGPFVVSLWTHPDVGVPSLFFVIVSRKDGSSIPKDLAVRIGVRPESGRLSEVVYDTWRDSVQDHVQYTIDKVSFDRDEFWKVRLVLASSAGGGELFSRVEATPVGLGKWDLLFYSSPFLLVAGLWFRGISRYRKRAKASSKSP